MGLSTWHVAAGLQDTGHVREHEFQENREEASGPFSDPVSGVTQQHFARTPFVEAITSQLRFKGRGHRACLSMAGRAINKFGTIS